MITTILLLFTLPTFCAAKPAPEHPQLAMFENNYCATQRIDCGQGHGTGVNLNADGFILTNNHVIAGEREMICAQADRWEKECAASGRRDEPCQNAKKLRQQCQEAKDCEIVVAIDTGEVDSKDKMPVIRSTTATVVARDPNIDLAVIKIGVPTGHYVVLVDVDWANIEENNDLCVGDYASGAGYCAGQDIYSIGFPLQLGLVISRGAINKLYSGMEVKDRFGKPWLKYEHELMYTPEPGGPGTSGSAVFLQSSGRFVGLTAKEISVMFNGLPVKFHTAVTLDRVIAFLDANGVAYATSISAPGKAKPSPKAGGRAKRMSVKH